MHLLVACINNTENGFFKLLALMMPMISCDGAQNSNFAEHKLASLKHLEIAETAQNEGLGV